jgi:phenylacetate-CoA ligase
MSKILSNLRFPPKSAAFVQEIRSAYKLEAFERAKRSPFYAGRLDHVRADHLGEAEEWSKIPVLTKDELRGIPTEDFHERFAIERDDLAVEYWRSGGATGRPLFYPRSAADMEAAMEMWCRLWLAAGCTDADKAHISFPLGIHPVGQLYARAGETLGIGTVRAGSGNNTPSEMQVELIRTLKPTVWVGMASYGLQLASLAERQGFDLSRGSVRKILCAAGPLSVPKREKLARLWNAEVFDQFGCTEAGAMGSESEEHDGLHMWNDMFEIEVVDETSSLPIAHGKTGLLVVTPFFTNTITPFLRWNTGDMGTLLPHGKTRGSLSLFPLFRHAARTSGFFKVRGININHADFEDFMHRYVTVVDFRLEVADGDGPDELNLMIELRNGTDLDAEVTKLKPL